MCYRKPGPRCSAHAQRLLTAAISSYKTEPTHENYEKMRQAELAYDQTQRGMQRIKDRLERDPHNAELKNRLTYAQEMRRLALEAIKAEDQGDVNQVEHEVIADPVVSHRRKLESNNKPADNVDYAKVEESVIEVFKPGTQVVHDNRVLTVIGAGKPRPSQGRQGESKTDVFIATVGEDGSPVNFKISVKKSNAQFLENKMSAERFDAIVGDDQVARQAIIEAARQRFGNKTLSAQHKEVKSPNGETDVETTYLLGYRADLMNTGSSTYIPWNPSKEQLLEIYAGTKQQEPKRNAVVNGLNGNKPIPDSGVASHILVGDRFDSAQQVIDTMIPLDQYVEDHPQVWFALKGVNYRVKRDKWDADRPLIFSVNWEKGESGLSGKVDVENLFATRANAVGERVRAMLRER